MRTNLFLVPVLLLMTACSSGEGAKSPPPSGQPVKGLPEGLPFGATLEGRFDNPFAMAFLPDGSLLVTEKAGRLQLRAPNGTVTEVTGVPEIDLVNQGGLLDVAVAPGYSSDHALYLSYSEPGSGGSSLALARATLDTTGGEPKLEGLKVLWRQSPKGDGGQFGAVIAFSPDQEHLFLASGERQRFTPAQDPDQALGKILRFNLDGSVPDDNPMASEGGARAITWSTGHRNPYGLVFAPDGRLWESEMGPKGGDELNLIESGKNYGWPNVSMGDNYDGSPIPDHTPGDGYQAPVVYWVPSISPGGAIIYTGSLFSQWEGSYLVGALSGEALIRVSLDGASATKADQWDLGMRIRDVAQSADGAVWLLEDGDEAKLMRLTPKAP